MVRLHASSGTTGKPTVVGYTRADLELWADVLGRGLVAGTMTENDIFQNSAGYGLLTGGLGFHDAAAKLGGKVFQAGTAFDEQGQIVTNGGRVLCAVALGDSVREAQRDAYVIADAIHWSGIQYRRDIGHHALKPRA